jgi:hypothetical protein
MSFHAAAGAVAAAERVMPQYFCSALSKIMSLFSKNVRSIV